jgi:hypothetical protein
MSNFLRSADSAAEAVDLRPLILEEDDDEALKLARSFRGDLGLSGPPSG